MIATIPGRRAFLGLAAAAALTMSLAACGAKSNETPGSGASTTPKITVDDALAAKVPNAIRMAGTIAVGTDSTYAPSEFLAADGKTVIGFDVDLFNAVAAKLGLKVNWQSAKFDDIIPGIGSGKYQVGVSSFTINDERKLQANMVSYYSAGTQWAAKKGASVNPDSACGAKVAVQTGTVQVDDLTARSKACTDAGKPAITIDQYQAQSDATGAIVSGKDVAMLADSPVSAYAVQQTKGQLALVGPIYGSAPYGYVVAKDQTDLAQALQGAVQALISDGTYKTVLSKWAVDAGAITTSAVNP
ncbi:MAG: polar amino acid transport system substrate-binding protein [Micromonosporaceae bacterium]|jgi:polar amino acid transport system substrate-binding protein|nr:polar amino acid transport system substrate-binding protein [Micromonosporaceae bacterium]MDT5037680.1 polar amino acid transport system substrate-binding protein [Micromonosporaceae bacterium]